jgi:hypothetical protein
MVSAADPLRPYSRFSRPVSAMYKLINSLSNREKLTDQWKEPIIIQTHEMGDETNCSNYGVISLLSTSNKFEKYT